MSCSLSIEHQDTFAVALTAPRPAQTTYLIRVLQSYSVIYTLRIQRGQRFSDSARSSSRFTSAGQSLLRAVRQQSILYAAHSLPRGLAAIESDPPADRGSTAQYSATPRGSRNGYTPLERP